MVANGSEMRAEAQRNFVRLKMPARAEVDGERFPVRDLSPGGLGVEGVARNYGDGADLNVALILPFDGVSLNFNLTGRVRHYAHTSKVLGLQFVNLSPAQVTILSQVVKAYIAGEMLNDQDLLRWASEDAFVKVLRRDEGGPAAAAATMPTANFMMGIQGPKWDPRSFALGLIMGFAFAALLSLLL